MSTLERLRLMAMREGQPLEVFLAEHLSREAANDVSEDAEYAFELTPHHIESIEAGIADLESGKFVGHEELFNKLREDRNSD